MESLSKPFLGIKKRRRELVESFFKAY